MCNMKRIILIDVDNLIDELEELSDSYVDNNCSDFTRGTYNICRQQGVDAAIVVVRKQKSVDPVKHGEWIERESIISCSVCMMDWDKNSNCYEIFHYCPYCGAKMDMGEE